MPFVLQVLLALSLIGFLLQLLLEYIKTIRVLLFSGTLVAIVVSVLAITLISLPKPKPSIPYTNVDTAYDSAQQFLFTQGEYESLLIKYQQLALLQPTDRDILINLSLLYLAQGNQLKADEVLASARRLDPNHPFFQ